MDETLPNKPGIAPDYHLGEADLEREQKSLVNSIRQETGQETIHAAWIKQNHEYANIIRTLEAQVFPEIPDVMEGFEEQSVFLALVDTREESQRVVHAFRLSSIRLTGQEELPEGDKTGIALIDDIVESDQGVTADAFKQYYAEQGVDLTKCISVETNFRVGDKVESPSDIPVTQLGYISVFQAVEKLGMEGEDAAIFAHLNEPAITSLDAVGISYQPVMGREDLRTPTVGDKPFDDNYKPVAIPATPENVTIFKNLVPFAAPQVTFDQ
jgi:hypothetical protein